MYENLTSFEHVLWKLFPCEKVRVTHQKDDTIGQ